MPSFDTPEPVTATIEVPVGDVRITASDRATTAVDVKPSDAASDEDARAAQLTRVEYAGGQLLVKAPKPRGWLGRSGRGSVDVTVALPAGSQVHAGGEATDFHCDGELGDCRVRTGLGQVRIDRAGALNVKSGIGDVTVDHASAHAEVTTGSGEIRMAEIGASAVIKNANGDTWVGAAAGDLRIKSANGSIAVDRAQATVAAKTSNGDVRLGAVTRDSVVLETQIGDLEVGIPEGTAAWLDVRATAGKVLNSLERAEAPDASAETVQVRARTAAGNVVIRRP